MTIVTFIRNGAAASVWLVLMASAGVATAQDLVPGAYTPAPVGVNVATVTATVNHGDVSFDPTLPIEDARATIVWSAVAYGRTLSVAGRSANLGLGFPVVFGNLSGRVNGAFQELTRSGLGDLSARFAVNLYGTPAMPPRQFASYRPSTVVALGAYIGAPIGAYDRTRAVNIGTNRWYVRSEIGISRTRNRWTFEGDVGGTFFTDNTDYREGGTRAQAAIASVQGHVIYTVRPGLWVAADGNFWKGGRVTIDGAPNVVEQKNSRLGLTVAVPVRRHQLRFAYSFGAFTTVGGDYQSLGVSYSYAWVGRP